MVSTSLVPDGTRSFATLTPLLEREVARGGPGDHDQQEKRQEDADLAAARPAAPDLDRSRARGTSRSSCRTRARAARRTRLQRHLALLRCRRGRRGTASLRAPCGELGYPSPVNERVIGVDLGGTKILAGLVEPDGDDRAPPRDADAGHLGGRRPRGPGRGGARRSATTASSPWASGFRRRSTNAREPFAAPSTFPRHARLPWADVRPVRIAGGDRQRRERRCAG